MISTQAFAYINGSGMAVGLFASPADLENKIQRLFQNAHSKARFHQLTGTLFRRSLGMLSLEACLDGHPIHSQSSAGIRSIAIEKIRGSESRSVDFDSHFCPLQERTQDRWVSVARVAVKGEPLPPVELVQVGSDYFVRDGHHRISVALALGQKAIEADITVITVDS